MLVVGLARSGQAAAVALARRGVEVVAADRATVDPGRLAAEGVEVHLGTEEEALLQGVELVIKSPGVPGESPLVAAARRGGVAVWSEIELGYRLLDPPILGITGTNGKTTRSSSSAPSSVLPGGRSRSPATSAVRLPRSTGSTRDTWVVCELSSFQLEDVVHFRAQVAALLDLEPDHLDRHGTFEAAAEKPSCALSNARDPNDVAVVPRGFGPVPGRGRRVEVDADDQLPAEPAIPGSAQPRERRRRVRGRAGAGNRGLAVARALRSFPGVPHRLELVTERAGVRFVNDLKADANVAAARRGVAAFEAPLRVILGGSSKGESFAPLAADLAGRTVTAYLIGETAAELAGALAQAGVSYVESGNLRAAVAAAARDAAPGEVVLLPPACAKL